MFDNTLLAAQLLPFMTFMTNISVHYSFLLVRFTTIFTKKNIWFPANPLFLGLT
jgi:hypothetical protein